MTTATPAESYPRYSSRFSPATTTRQSVLATDVADDSTHEHQSIGRGDPCLGGRYPASVLVDSGYRELALHHHRQVSRHFIGALDRVRLDHHPDQRLRSGGAQQDPTRRRPAPVPPRPPRQPRPGCPRGRPCPPRRTLISTCGNRVITDASSARRPARGHFGQHVQRGEHAVTGRGVLAHDDVTALLAAEHVTRPRASPRGRSGRPPSVSRSEMPADAIARLKPRFDITVPTTVFWASVPALRSRKGQDGEQSDRRPRPCPCGVHGQAAIGVAVMRDPRVRTLREHFSDQGIHVRGPAVAVDVVAVGVVVDRDHLGASRPQRHRGDLAGGPVGAIHDNLEPRQ